MTRDDIFVLVRARRNKITAKAAIAPAIDWRAATLSAIRSQASKAHQDSRVALAERGPEDP